jgi:predicted peroxiredoxin
LDPAIGHFDKGFSRLIDKHRGAETLRGNRGIRKGEFHMLRFLRPAGIVILLAVLSFSMPASAEAKKGLFINLTSDELNRAARAIALGISALERGDIDVTIFLNVEGANLADKNRPQHTHATLNMTPHDLLRDFIKKGGNLMVCPMCMRSVGGMREEDLMGGVHVASPDRIFDLMYTEGTHVVSY